MRIHPMTVEEALDYAPKAALLDFDGPVTPDLIMAVKEHLSYAVSALSVVSAKLFEAESAIVDLHQSNLELAALVASAREYKSPVHLTQTQARRLKARFEGGIDPEYGRQMSFEDVPTREPIAIIEDPHGLREYGLSDAQIMARNRQIEHGAHVAVEPKTLYDGDTGKIYDLLDGRWVERVPVTTTVEFRTDPGTYDAHRSEIHRVLAEEISAQFGTDKSAANPSELPLKSAGNPSERGTETDSK